MKKFFNYAKGDAKAGIWWHPVQQFASHNINIILIFLRFILGLVVLIYSFENPLLTYVLLIGVFAYVIWPIFKWRGIVKTWQARRYLPVVQIASDLVIMAGFISGFIYKK
jgi:hypothetical protein